MIITSSLVIYIELK